MKYIFKIFILFFSFSINIFSQTDTTSVVDTLSSNDEIETLVNYNSSDSIIYDFNSRSMKLFGKSGVKQAEMSLKSEFIDIDWNTSSLLAKGIIDSTKPQTDSLKKRYFGLPIMTDGPDEYKGFNVAYNFKSKKGKVVLGDTEQEQGYYHGQQIKKIDKNILYVANGRYTTCDDAHPHFYFYSPQMKITLRDKIIARPIYLYIADVPIFALPFGVFPNQNGRRSGIIAPTYGEHWQRGRYLSHLGYYWAANDYFDINFLTDLYSHGGWRAYSDLHYGLKYNFSGRIFMDYSRITLGEKDDFDRRDESNYRANLQHFQQLSPNSRIDVDFTFASNNSYKTSTTYEDLLRQEIYSNATYSKTFEGTSNSMNLNISRRQDLRTGDVYSTFPSMNFAMPQIYPFKSKKKSRGLQLLQTESSWYELIGMSYNTQFLRLNNKIFSSEKNSFSELDRYGLSHSLSVNASPKIKNFNLSPYLSYSEKWYDKSIIVDSVDGNNNPIKREVFGFAPVRFYNLGVSASTRLYGMMQLPIKGFGGFRHTLMPSLTYSYQPDFSTPNFDFYRTYKDKNGKEILYNRFEREIFGGAPQGKSQALSLNVSNLFEAKTIADDSVRTEKKYQLLNLNASLYYNFSAPQFQLSDLNLSFRTDIGQYLNLSGGSTYRFYDYDSKNLTRVNSLLWKEKGRIADLTNINFSMSTSLRGEKNNKAEVSTIDSLRLIESQEKKLRGYRTLYETDPPDFSIPWNLSLSFFFSQNQDNPNQIFRSANMSANLSFNLTEKWKFNASSSYDLVKKEFAAPFITIYRDLHCWEMNFSWTPIGYLKGYRFEIRVKAPHLQDVKMIKQSREAGYY